MVAILLAIWEFLVALGPFLTALFGVIVSIATAIWEITKIYAIVLILVGAFEILFDPRGKQRVGNFLANVVGGAITVATPLLTALAPSLQGIVQGFATAFSTTGPGLAATVAEPAGAFASSNFNATIAALGGVGESTADNAVSQASTAIKDAFGKGISSAAATAAFESLFPERLNTLNGIGPMLAQMAGFGDVSAAIREPLYRAAFGKSAEYKFNSQFTPNLPDKATAAEWLARRIIGPAEFDTLYDATGFKAIYESNYTAAAYRPLNPRVLAQLYVDVPVDTNQVTELLQDYGVSDLHVPILVQAIQYNSLKNLRNQYVSSVTRNAELGTISEAELQADLEGLGFSMDAVNLCLLVVASKRLDSLLTIFRNDIYTLYSTAQLSLAQVTPALEAAGMDPMLAEGYAALWSAKVTGKELAAAARAEAKLIAQEVRLAVASTKALFLSGQIDTPAMLAALTASGLDLNLVPLTATVFEAEFSARRQNVFGRLVSHSEAILLRERVAATKEAAIKSLITIDAAKAQLLGYGIPAVNAQALVSEYSAALKLSPQLPT